MSLNEVFLRRELVKLARTSFEIENAMAFAAVEVMMVRQTGQLVANSLAGNIDRRQPFVFDKIVNRTINSGDAKVGDVALGFLENLGGAERAAGFTESAFDGISLAGSSLHGAIDNRFLISIARPEFLPYTFSLGLAPLEKRLHTIF